MFLCLPSRHNVQLFGVKATAHSDYPILGISWSSVIKEVHQLKACPLPRMGKWSELSQGELPGCQALHFNAALGRLNQINYAFKSMSTSVSTCDKSGQDSPCQLAAGRHAALTVDPPLERQGGPGA